ncbi:ALF repeat-containing protein, partial [Kitasatospora sp. NPDC047058]|uniref:ALF repeat-containing protein n=1 Tax=Kitasatospora sp. NPDC047058 TaxID=3155620 RepID=UPI0033D54330
MINLLRSPGAPEAPERKRHPGSRIAGLRGACAVLLPVALAAGLLGPAPAFAAGPAPVYNPPVVTDRDLVLNLWTNGGTGVKAAAEAALTGSDEDVKRFLEVGRDLAEYHDDRVAAFQMFSLGGAGVREAATTALKGSVGDLRAFLNDGWKTPLEQDRRVEAFQLVATGGVTVREQATAALFPRLDRGDEPPPVAFGVEVPAG